MIYQRRSVSPNQQEELNNIRKKTDTKKSA